MAITIEKMRKLKEARGYTYEDIARLSGVPLSTVQKVFHGTVKRPRRETLEALAGVFEGKSASAPVALAEDGSVVYTAGSGNTIENYFALPDDVRMELIDGVFYDMAAPTVRHQGIAGRFYYIVQNYLDGKKGSCFPIMSPVDVQLDEDDYTMVQPDFLIVCDKSKIREGRIFGAPDFVMEVLSPSTARKDTLIKLKKYLNADVKEYWVIDPEKKKVIVYDSTQEEMVPAIYGFDAVIPVALYQGELKIDMNVIYEDIAFTYDT